jgi:hypothetical protein
VAQALISFLSALGRNSEGILRNYEVFVTDKPLYAVMTGFFDFSPILLKTVKIEAMY